MGDDDLDLENDAGSAVIEADLVDYTDDDRLAELVQQLNPRHKRFADEYLGGKNASDAARAVDYRGHVGLTAHRLLKRPDVAEYVRIMRTKSTRAAEITASEWREELGAIAFSNILDFVDDNGEIDIKKASRAQARAIQSFRTKKRTITDNRGQIVGEETSVDLRLWDKLRALELVGKAAGFIEADEHKVVIDVADRLLAARQRVLAIGSRPDNGEAE